MSGRLPVDAPLIAGHVSLQTWHPTRAGGGSRRAHRSYAVRMSDSRVSPQEIRAAAAANAELGARVLRRGDGTVPGMRSAVLRPVRWGAGPLLLAAAALAFDAADRRIPFGVWTTGPVDEVAHLATAALGLLVLARFIDAPRRFYVGALIASVAIDADHIPLYLGLLGNQAQRPVTHSLSTVAVFVAAAAVFRAPGRAGRGGDRAGAPFRAGRRRGLPRGAGLLAASGHFLDGQLPVVPGHDRRAYGGPSGAGERRPPAHSYPRIPDAIPVWFNSPLPGPPRHIGRPPSGPRAAGA